MKILFTGAYGFVATNISKFLKESTNAKLVGVDIKKGGNAVYDEFVFWKDLPNYNWNNIDTIIHLAGKAHDTKNASDAQSYYDINLGLTKEIFGFFERSSAKRFIFFSSVKAVADKIDNEILTENEQPSPQTPYGKSKLAAEQFILNQEISGDKKIYILRPCMIHGPGNKGNLNLLYKVVEKRIPWPLGAFKNKRSLCSIDNLSYLITELIQKDVASGIYNIADDEPVSTNRIIELMADSIDRKSYIWNINRTLIQRISIIGDKMGLPLNSERLKKLTETYIVSNRKILTALKIDRLPVKSEKGLQKTLLSFRN